jgi:hypothetical protein
MSNAEREGSRPSNRDAALERAWRKASAEQPPTDLDASIIAAARKSVPNRGDSSDTVGVRGRSRNCLTQWPPLAAAAAVAGLAFVLVQTLPREHGLAPTLQRKESAPAPAELQSHRASARDATDDNRQAPSADRGEAQRGHVAVPDRTPAPGAVPAPPPAPAPSASIGAAPASDTAQSAGAAAAVGETATDRTKAAEPELAGRTVTNAVAAPSSPARERVFGNTATLDAAGWAARIVTLYESGDLPAAEDALRAFRVADPDADTYLPDSLRTWARTVQ